MKGESMAWLIVIMMLGSLLTIAWGVYMIRRNLTARKIRRYRRNNPYISFYDSLKAMGYTHEQARDATDEVILSKRAGGSDGMYRDDAGGSSDHVDTVEKR